MYQSWLSDGSVYWKHLLSACAEDGWPAARWRGIVISMRSALGYARGQRRGRRTEGQFGVAILHDDSLPLDGLTAADLSNECRGLAPRWQRFRTRMAVLTVDVSHAAQQSGGDIHPVRGVVNANASAIVYRKPPLAVMTSPVIRAASSEAGRRRPWQCRRGRQGVGARCGSPPPLPTRQ